MMMLIRSLFSGKREPAPIGLDVVVRERREETAEIASFRLEAPDGAPLPRFTAGAHIDVHLGTGEVRQYSLCSDAADTSHYRIAVLREDDGRGGSVGIHRTWCAGTELRVAQPRNNFPLADAGGRFHLIAGGIGVTPLLAMAIELRRRGDEVAFHYCARAPERAAFAEELQALLGPTAITFHYSETAAPNPLDVEALLGRIPEADFVYCCGPQPLIDAVETAGRDRVANPVRVERFAPAASSDTEAPAPFEVTLAQSGDRFTVPAGSTLLDELLARGHRVDCSCREGICGSCRIEHLAGDVLHRDHALSAADRATAMAPCVSRARGSLVVNL